MSESNVSSPEKRQAELPPEVGGIRFGPALAGALYALLVGSAALALWIRPFPGRVPADLARAAPWVFLVFAACFAVYRLALVRARKYPAAKAFFQIGIALFFFTLLLPRQRPAAPPEEAVSALLGDADPRVRALAAEMARYRPDGSRYAPRLVRALEDPDPSVRKEAHESLVRLSGRDLGDPGDPAALQAWKERYP